MANESLIRRPFSEVRSASPAVLDRLRRRYASPRRLKVGYMGYEPFVTSNGELGGPLIDAAREMAAELQTELDPRPSTWPEFAQQLRRGQLDIVMEPIMPALNRHVDIIPYCTLEPAHFACKVAYANEIRSRTQDITNAVTNPLEYKRARMQVQAIAKIGKGLAVSVGTIAELLLQCFMADDVATYQETDLLISALDACEKDYLFLTTYPTALKLRDLHPHTYEVVPFLDMSVPAGIAVDFMNDDLRQFIMGFRGISTALDKINTYELNNSRIKIIWDAENPQVISQFPLFLPIASANRTAGAAARDLRQPLLTILSQIRMKHPALPWDAIRIAVRQWFDDGPQLPPDSWRREETGSQADEVNAHWTGPYKLRSYRHLEPIVAEEIRANNDELQPGELAARCQVSLSAILEILWDMVDSDQLEARYEVFCPTRTHDHDVVLTSITEELFTTPRVCSQCGEHYTPSTATTNVYFTPAPWYKKKLQREEAHAADSEEPSNQH
jgi:hypothetical protein